MNQLDLESESYDADLASLNEQISTLNEAQQTNINNLETLESELQESEEFTNELASIEQKVEKANSDYQDAIANEEIALNEATGNQNP